MSSTQHGFLPRRSCLSSLLQFFEILTSNLEVGVDCNAIYIDFAKAFDSVPHRLLLHKLESFGISGALLAWIKCFLTGRKQRVVIRGQSSAWVPVLSGVPQGSVLGPLLFVLYVDDIDSCFLHSTVLKYADDVKVVSALTSDDSCQLLQSDLDRLTEWSRQWLLSVNLGKCCVIHFGSKNKRNNFFLNENLVSEASSECDLGVDIAENLKPSQQCLKAAASAQRILNLIRLSFQHLDVLTFSQIYRAVVRPRLEYCIPVWSPYLQKDICILEKVQRRATRMISHLRTLSYRDRLNHFHLTSLKTRRLLLDLVTVYKILNGFIDVSPSDFFTFNRDSTTRGHSFKLKVNFSHLNCRRFFFSQRVVAWWNKLPQDCVAAPSIKLFKTKVKSFFLLHDLW